MIQQPGPLIDMTPDGGFRAPRRSPIANRIVLWAIVVAVVAAAGALAALALWLAFLLIPVIFVAGAVAYLAFRFQIWRARASFGRQRPRNSSDIFRP